MKRLLLCLAALVVGCSGRVETDSEVEKGSERVETDDRPAFAIDRTKPFWIEIGRGGHKGGLDTIKIDQTGRVILHRTSRRKKQDGSDDLICEVATLQLSPEALVEALKSVDAANLMALGKAYYRVALADGTQWILWIRQGEQEKAVYCDNSFPKAITEFAEQLDALLGRAGLENTTWTSETWKDFSENERELKGCIRRLRLPGSVLGNLE
jgi:hypothetical protein